MRIELLLFKPLVIYLKIKYDLDIWLSKNDALYRNFRKRDVRVEDRN